jgi:regulator of ribosome biosynthesis
LNLQVPKEKELTKWEKFAKEKGIVKKKRSRMLFDEEKGEYLPRFGYKKANDQSKQWAFEHKEGAGILTFPMVA